MVEENSLDSVGSASPSVENPRPSFSQSLTPLEPGQTTELNDPLVKHKDRQHMGDLVPRLGRSLQERVVVHSEIAMGVGVSGWKGQEVERWVT